MFKKREITNSYLAANEFIYRAAIIGLAIGLINMVADMYKMYGLGADFVSLLFSLIYPLAYVVVGAVIGMLVFPVYKIYAQKRGGLTISIIVREDTYNNSSNSTVAKDAPSS